MHHVGRQAALYFITALAVARCGAFGGGCDPKANFTTALAVKKSLISRQNSGSAVGGLIYPNPIEASGNPNLSATSSGVNDLLKGFRLPGLTSASSLDTDFIKIREKAQNESTLAAPNSNGVYAFAPNATFYAQTMAAYALRSEMNYLEALGFPFCKSRPLYVLTRVESDTANALYDHGYLTPSAPRLMRMYGTGAFATGLDARMYHHELGHMFVECTSRERKIDFAGDNGSMYEEASAMHEGFADYTALTFTDHTQLGEWLNRNYQDVTPGEPLRRAVDTGTVLKFTAVGMGDDIAKVYPERYKVSEWFLRTLWDIRTKMVEKKGEVGALHADYLFYSALSQQQQDTTLLQYTKSLYDADATLFCGGNHDLIRSAFENRGFSLKPLDLDKALDVTVRQVGITYTNGNAQHGSPKPGGSVTFAISLKNSGTRTARNVRARLVSSSPQLRATTYMQGYGDMAPGATLAIGDGKLTFDYSVWADIDQSAAVGSSLRYAIEILVENADTRRLEGVLAL